MESLSLVCICYPVVIATHVLFQQLFYPLLLLLCEDCPAGSCSSSVLAMTSFLPNTKQNIVTEHLLISHNEICKRLGP